MPMMGGLVKGEARVMIFGRDIDLAGGAAILLTTITPSPSKNYLNPIGIRGIYPFSETNIPLIETNE
jgi:hypothetical protein